MAYDFKTIEPKWQAYWRAHRAFCAPNPGEPGFDPAKPKYYVLDMFPYPSGAGLHVGHPEGYTATDIVARYKRARGFNVLHPMGWDAFGLPAEEYARETNQPPEQSVRINIANFRRQIESLGFSYDWDREFSTTDATYYRWTQWIFLKLWNAWFDPIARRARPIAELPIPPDVAVDPALRQNYVNDRRLAYQSDAPVWWCESLGTVMANEEVNSEGRTVDKGYPCERISLRQWLFRITAFADRLIDGLSVLDWPEGIKRMQRDWIGRSEGAEVSFQVVDATPDIPAIRVFTTRPDTLFGATYLVLAPEHALVDRITTVERREDVERYRKVAASKQERDRIAATSTKTGVDTGALALNPVNGEAIPVWVSDYVLASYGTGAIMAVPAHDQRDFDFAKTFDLPIRTVVQPQGVASMAPLEKAFEGEGIAVNSPWIDGLSTGDALLKIIAELETRGTGKARTTYRLRDWLFSRQRYWGEPFPIIHTADGEAIGIAESELPLLLPHLDDHGHQKGQHEAPLARATDWVHTKDANGRPARRETDTMPGWAGSCWYFLRFTDARNDGAAWSDEAERYWMPVDLYIGGAEHAVLHLLYARFWHQALYDLGYASSPEPFQKLFNQGLIMAYVAETKAQAKVPWDKAVQTKTVEKDGEDAWVHAETGEPLTIRVGKMSKSLKNVVNPDEVIASHGADTMRLYEMFMGPLQDSKPWNPRGVTGPLRFLERVHSLIIDREGGLRVTLLDDRTPDPKIEVALHRAIKAVTDDIEALRFNTAIARMMEFVNEVAFNPAVLTRSQARRFVQILSPFAPHLGEELWELLGGTASLAYEPWPGYDEALLRQTMVECVVQIAGKVRARIEVAVTTPDADIEAQARVAAARWLPEPSWRCIMVRNQTNVLVSFAPSAS